MDGLSTSHQPQESEVSPRKRTVTRNVAVFGAGLVAVLGAAWVGRLPLGEFFVKQQFSEPGAPAKLSLSRLDFGGITANSVSLGGGPAPDFTAKRIDVDFVWRGFSLGIGAVRADEPVLRVNVNERGYSLGVLDRALPRGGGAGTPGPLPDLTLAITKARVIFETPLGAFTATGEGAGALRRDFRLAAQVAPIDTAGPRGAIQGLTADLAAQTNPDGLSARLTAKAAAATLGADSATAPTMLATVTAGSDLSNAALDAELAAARAAYAGHEAGAPALRAHFEPSNLLAPKTWNGRISAALTSLSGQTANGANANIEIVANGDETNFSGALTAKAARAAAFGVSAEDANLSGPLSGSFAGGPLSITARADLAANRTSVDTPTRRDLLAALPAIGGTPLDPLMRSARTGLDRALQRFALTAPLSFTWNNRRGRLAAAGDVNIIAASGAKIAATPLNQTQPAFAASLPDGALSGAARIGASGGGLPNLQISASRFALDGKAWALDGDLYIDDWRGADAAAQANITVNARSGAEGGEARVRGDLTLTGPLAGMRLVNAKAPLDVVARWSKGWEVAPANGCMDVRADSLEAFGFVFPNAPLPLCSVGGAFAAADENGALRGGFTLAPPQLRGRMAGSEPRPAQLTMAGINGRLSGTISALALDTIVSSPALAITWDAARRVNLRGKQITANLRTGESWGVNGVFSDVWVEDSTAPARLESFNATWRAAPRGDDAVISFAGGAGRVFDWHEKTVISPLRVTDVGGTIENGQAKAIGKIALEKTGASLGEFDATHDLESGAGRAQARARNLTFSPALQPYEVSETLRGVVDNVAGPIDADFNARWATDFAVDARVDLKSLNLATAALGPTEAIVGEIKFNDFLTLSTPPGQIIHAGRINPGVPVEDGIVRFQMLPDLNLKIEDARWPFAGGSLFVQPTTINLASPEMRLTLALQSVDVAKLTEELNIKGLTATGQVEGQFPLIFADGKGRIEKGRLVAGPQGGLIAYESDLGKAGGPASIAFGALQSFRYDSLALDLDGALDGELVTQIAFSGVNNEPVEQAAGPTALKIVGIPFKFNVNVRAPFMALARTAGSFSDVGGLINQSLPADVNVNVQTPP